MKLKKIIKNIFRIKVSKFAISGFTEKIIKKDIEKLKKNLRKSQECPLTTIS